MAGYGGTYVPSHPPASAAGLKPSRQASQLGLGGQYEKIRWCAVHVESGTGIAQTAGLARVDRTELYIDLTLEKSLITEIAEAMEMEEAESDLVKERLKTHFEEAAKASDSAPSKIASAFSMPESSISSTPPMAFGGGSHSYPSAGPSYGASYGGGSSVGYSAVVSPPMTEKEKRERDLISQLRMLHSGMDEVQARHFLEKYEWDMVRAAEAAYAAESQTEIISKSGRSGGAPMGSAMAGSHALDTSVLRVRVPDGRVFTYRMQARDSFWSVYGYVVESAPELASRPFTFVLANGHRLAESEFDMNLVSAACVPEGFVSISF